MLFLGPPVPDPGRCITCSSQAGEREGKHGGSLLIAKHKQRCQSKAGDMREAEEEMCESCNLLYENHRTELKLIRDKRGLR